MATMLKITVQEDCGNAPKMALLRDFKIAFAKADRDFLLAHVADTVRWNVVGNKVLEGKDAFADEAATMQPANIVELTLENIMTHGRVGAMDGVMRMADGTSYAFCDVYNFSSAAKDAKIKAITSYVISI